MTTRARGATLVELLAACSLFAVIAYITATLVFPVLRTYAVSAAAAGRVQSLARLLNRLDGDIRGAAPSALQS